MPRPTASPDLIASHYTRVSGTGEAANRASAASLGTPDAPTQLKETIMRRTFTTATLLALTISAAQAGDIVTVHFGDLDPTNAKDAQLVTARIHDAAEAACARAVDPQMGPVLYYDAIFKHCIDWTSKSAMTRYQALAATASRTKLAGK